MYLNVFKGKLMCSIKLYKNMGGYPVSYKLK